MLHKKMRKLLNAEFDKAKFIIEVMIYDLIGIAEAAPCPNFDFRIHIIYLVHDRARQQGDRILPESYSALG